METIGIIEEGETLSRCLAASLGRPLRLGPAARRADLVVICPRFPPLPQAPLLCRVLLLPGPQAPLAGQTKARWVVSYGLASRDTLTLSSLAPQRPCLALQRELVTLTGTCLEPQEIPLPARFPPLSPLHLLAWAGTCLLLGVPPESLCHLPLSAAKKSLVLSPKSGYNEETLPPSEKKGGIDHEPSRIHPR